MAQHPTTLPDLRHPCRSALARAHADNATTRDTCGGRIGPPSGDLVPNLSHNVGEDRERGDLTSIPQNRQVIYWMNAAQTDDTGPQQTSVRLPWPFVPVPGTSLVPPHPSTYEMMPRTQPEAAPRHMGPLSPLAEPRRDNAQCTFCQSTVSHGETVCRLVCGHMFHQTCWEQNVMNRVPLSGARCNCLGPVVAQWNHDDSTVHTQYSADGMWVRNRLRTRNNTPDLSDPVDSSDDLPDLVDSSDGENFQTGRIGPVEGANLLRHTPSVTLLLFGLCRLRKSVNGFSKVRIPLLMITDPSGTLESQ